MVNLVTLGGQHQGVMGYPGCKSSPFILLDIALMTCGLSAMHDMSSLCRVVQRAIHTGVYLPYIRDTIIQAQYYKVSPQDKRMSSSCSGAGSFSDYGVFGP